MRTVFSYVIQKRFSEQNEDVATEALAFLLNESAAIRSAFVKILRGLSPDLPELEFRSQKQEGQARPDIVGRANGESRVLIENKFWAGLTDQQPNGYLDLLSRSTQPAILVVVVPEVRAESIWRELLRRLRGAQIELDPVNGPSAFARTGRTSTGPLICVLPWTHLLTSIEVSFSDDPVRRNDVEQLKALCDAADAEAFTPISAEELTNQRTPALILQLKTIIESAFQRGTSDGVVARDGLLPQASWDRIGRYIKLPGLTYFWFGTNFELWLRYGSSPLWMVFYQGKQYEPLVAQASLIEKWTAHEGLFSTWHGDEYIVPVPVVPEEEKDYVVQSIIDFWKRLSSVLEPLRITEPY